MYIIDTMANMKGKRHIYPLEFDGDLYSKLKEYAKKHGKQSISSVVRYAVALFLQKRES